MSILQEYETIRKQIGEKEYSDINKYLDKHSKVLLSDIYYKKSAWDKFKTWQAKQETKIDLLEREI